MLGSSTSACQGEAANDIYLLLEINPKDAVLLGRYKASPEQQFFSGHISGAERLKGGNVLICEGTSGRLFEITPGGEVVWEWINPFVHRNAAGMAMSWIFRAHRYLPAHAGGARTGDLIFRPPHADA